MISYRAPKVPTLYYFCAVSVGNEMGWLGPFHAPNTSFDLFEARDPSDFIKESKGLFGENNVSHRQLTAKLEHSILPTLFKGIGPWEGVPIKQRYPDGRFFSSDWLRPAQMAKNMVKTGYRMASSHTVHSANSLTNYYFRESSGMVSSATTVHGLTAINLVITPKDLQNSTLTVVTTTTSYSNLTFYPGDDTSEMSLVYNGEHYRDRIIAGDFPAEGTKVERSVSTVTNWWHEKPLSSDVSLSSVIRDIRIVAGLPTPSPSVKSHGELGQEAIETLDANNVNMIAFVKDIRKPWELIPKLKELSKMKTHASNYLGYQYGILPTISDLSAIYEAVVKNTDPYFDANRFRVLTSGASGSVTHHLGETTVTNRCKIAIIDSDSLMVGLGSGLHNIGAFPTLTDIYDLIPYSFVLDWFISVGDVLEQVDYRGRVASLDVQYSTVSSKTVTRYDVPQHLLDAGITGDITVTRYDRTVSKSAPTTPLNFEVSNGLPSHWLEAGALIVARK